MYECVKRTYYSEHKAKQEAKFIEKHGKRLRVYQCERCHYWHLTSDLYRNDFNADYSNPRRSKDRTS